MCAGCAAKVRDAPQFQGLGKPTEEPREDAHHIPQQGVVGRMMNVGLHHRGVDPQPPPSSRPSFTAASTTRSLTALSVAGVSRLKLRLKASCLGTSSQ